jgi:hypothetical protein
MLIVHKTSNSNVRSQGCNLRSDHAP